MEGPRPLVVVRPPGQGIDGQLFPLFGEEARHEDVVGASELAADLGDLRGSLPLSENDFREPDAAQTIEVECVVGGRHCCAG
jgi:hypothetical protein